MTTTTSATKLPPLVPPPSSGSFTPKLQAPTAGAGSGNPMQTVINSQNAQNANQTAMVKTLSGGRRFKSVFNRRKSKKNITRRRIKVKRIRKKSRKFLKKSRKFKKKRRFGGDNGTIVLPQNSPQSYQTPPGGTSSQSLLNNTNGLLLKSQVAGQYNGNVKTPSAVKGGARPWGCMS